MDPHLAVTNPRLTTPRAAAVAGILFALLLGVSLILVRLAIPAEDTEPGQWLRERRGYVLLALNLVPFAGIAFLWFIGVIRDHLGEREDRFFATVFLGSGLLFLAMLFASSAVVASMIVVFAEATDEMVASTTYAFARTFTNQLLYVYAIRMAGVFMISLCTLSMRLRILPRWMVYLGYVLALGLLLTIARFAWIFLVFPAWVLLVSSYILIDKFNHSNKPEPKPQSV